jgi:hypothetical protein
MLRGWWIVVLGGLGCGRIRIQTSERADGGPPDGGGAATLDASFCLGTLVHTCLPTEPTDAVAFDTATDIDTELSPRCEPIDQFCVIAATRFEITARVTAHGSRALVLVAVDTIDLSGVIDVSSELASGAIGAGANPSTCDRGAPPTDAGGGAGGSFGGAGGRGQPIQGIQALPGASSRAIPSLRGGCPGQPGSTPDVRGGGGARGEGGGAVALVASTIVLSGRINASGGGGGGGRTGPSGGGGGGSGGMIVLDAASIPPQPAAMLFANGGGGGEGGGIAQDGSGAIVSGLDGGVSTGPGPTGGAIGGKQGSNNQSGDGADGSLGTQLDGADATDPISEPGGGGGGGGGGAGFIHAPGIEQVSPPSLDPAIAR